MGAFNDALRWQDDARWRSLVIRIEELAAEISDLKLRMQRLADTLEALKKAHTHGFFDSDH